LYGVFSMMAILKLPPGNERMQDIAAAIQAGAKAYLNRQYTTIAVVGVVLFVAIGFALNCTPPADSRSARFSPDSPATSA